MAAEPSDAELIEKAILAVVGSGALRVDVHLHVNGELVGTLAKIGAALEELSKTRPPPHLTQLQREAIEAAPSAAEAPITVKELAIRAGYAYTGHFRSSVARLVELGLLVRSTDGVRKPE